MNVTIDLVNASSDQALPEPQDFRHWAEAAMQTLAAVSEDSIATSSELSIRLVDEDESAGLNEHYRHKNGPTNILSFPFSGVNGSDVNLLGDLAICVPLVKKEAAEQDKSEAAHWAHLTVHGVLHLHGFDHEDVSEADAMEALEIRIMQSLGFANPYAAEVE